MKITSPWRRNNNTNKKKPVASKPKIALEQLGLKHRRAAETSLSIDEIRRRVIQASNQALGQRPESQPTLAGARGSDGSTPAGARPKAASRDDAGRDRVGVFLRRDKR